MVRKHQLSFEAKSTAEKGGGPRIVEERNGRTISEMYQRMLITGEMERMAVNKHNSHGTREEVLKMLDTAKKAPQYMTNSEIDEGLKDFEQVIKKAQEVTKEQILKEKMNEKIEQLKAKNELKILKNEIDFQQDLAKAK